jgi:hypothetical protein
MTRQGCAFTLLLDAFLWVCIWTLLAVIVSRFFG